MVLSLKRFRKKVEDIMAGAVIPGKKAPKRFASEIDDQLAILKLKPNDIGKTIKSLEKAMLKHAKDLEFEQAAALRDKIKQLQDDMMGFVI